MKILNANAFKQSLAMRARMYAASAGYRIRYGAAPQIDLEAKVIYLPDLPLGEVDPDTQKLFDGWLVHEALGHGKYTRQGAIEAIRADVSLSLQQKKVLKGLLNSVEDPRCESEAVAYLPGVDQALRGMLAVAVQKGMVRDGTKGPADALEMYVCHWGRLFLLGHTEVQQHYQTARSVLEQYLGTDGLLRVEGLVSTEMPRLRNTMDALGLARSIHALVQEIAEGQQTPPPQAGDNGDLQNDGAQENQDPASPSSTNEDGKEEGSDTTSDAEGNGEDGQEEDSTGDTNGDDEEEGSDTASESDDNGDEGQEEDSTAETNAAGEEEGSDTTSGPDGNSEDGEGADASDSADSGNFIGSEQETAPAMQILEDENAGAEDPLEVAGALAQAIKEEVEHASAQSEGGREAVVMHNDHTDSSSPTKAKQDLAQYRKVQAEVTAKVATLKQRLVALLSAQKRSHTELNRKGRLSGRHLHRVLVGNPNVFARKVTEIQPAAAVTILQDMSYSMVSDGLTGIAQQTLVAAAEAMHGIGNPFEVLGFGSDEGAGAAGLVEIKPFGAALGQYRDRLGGYVSMSHGGTPMGEAMFEAGLRLLQQPASRRIMMVITDGEPNSSAYTVEVTNLLTGMGVECLGVGICSDAVQGLFPRYTVVRDLDTLGREVFNMLKGTLMAA